MCFGSQSKDEDPSPQFNNANNLNPRPVEPTGRSSFSKMPQNESYAPPTGPPPSHSSAPPATVSSNNPYSQAQTSSNNQYAPPSGPPPSHSQYAPPSGPPPTHNQYAPPLGPPPSHGEYALPLGPPSRLPPHDEYAPPSGPPPSQQPVHDWKTAVPDTSLLPPPPSLGNQRSATNNATEQEAEQGESWCHINPMRGPLYLPAEVLFAVDHGEIGIIKPRSYKGDIDRPRPGVWVGKTKSSSPDSCITTSVPLYSVLAHSPLNMGNMKTIYYEVRINKKNRREVSLALGFTAPPYPTFRLPGWHRGSLAVHGDDGSKFINDSWGGKDFTAPFKAGETLGIGMTFSKRDLNQPPAYSDGPLRAQTEATTPINVEIFFTRDGKKTGGWNLHEEGDSVEDRPVTGLEGMHDLYAAVGTFENVEFEIIFNASGWMYRP